MSQSSLDQLPFASALIGRNEIFLAVNALWREAHPDAVSGSPAGDWCHQLYAAKPHPRDALVAGIRSVLEGGQPAFMQTYGSHRIVVLPSPIGANVLYEAIDEQRPASDFQSQRMEAMGRLLGGVAHDFANLLTLIAGYTEILLNRIGGRDPLRPELEEIRRAANRGAGLTAQLLGFTRGHAAEPRVVNLNNLIREMERMLRPIIGEDISFETALAEDLGSVIVDPGQVEQVVMNLLLNARDAMPGGGRIRVETRNSDSTQLGDASSLRPGSYVVLSVSDTGPGIDAETRKRVFQPFFSTKQQGKGTGLGLSTASSIVKEAGGDIWVSSAPAHGALFAFCLPRVESAPDVPVPSSATAVPKQAGSETVLLVEDEDGVRQLLSHVLRQHGYQVIEASNGAEAMQIFEQRRGEIRLVLTDIMMPRMNGRELAVRLRELQPGLKIIYMSGYTDEVLVRAGSLDPGITFLQKPLRPRVLAAQVREALDS